METINYKGYEITTEQDYDAPNPRVDMDNLFTFIGMHRRYNSPDEMNQESTGNLIVDVANFYDNDFTANETKKAFAWVKANLVFYPVYLEEHDVLSFGFSKGDPWDSGLFGAIFVTKEKALKEYSAKQLTKKIRDNLESVARAELKAYEDYANGFIYSVSLSRNGVYVDSTGGIDSDSVSEIIEEMKAIADSNIEERKAASLSVLKEMLAKKAPIEDIPAAVIDAYETEPKQVYYTYSKDAGDYVAAKE